MKRQGPQSKSVGRSGWGCPTAGETRRIEDDRGLRQFRAVTGTPEEVIIDFGLNPQLFGPPTEPVIVSQRIIVNFFTAKRLLAALAMTTQRHESAFGVLETDVQKRSGRSGYRPAAAPLFWR